jgi:hypothetical protein
VIPKRLLVAADADGEGRRQDGLQESFKDACIPVWLIYSYLSYIVYMVSESGAPGVAVSRHRIQVQIIIRPSFR